MTAEADRNALIERVEKAERSLGGQFVAVPPEDLRALLALARQEPEPQGYVAGLEPCMAWREPDRSSTGVGREVTPEMVDAAITGFYHGGKNWRKGNPSSVERLRTDMREALRAAFPGMGEGTKAEADYVMHYGGRCRDCADEDGICPSTGLPCDQPLKRKAVEFVLEAITYGHEHGFIVAPSSVENNQPKGHGSPELDQDAAKLEAMGQDAGPTLDDLTFCPACEAFPVLGYCKLAGCPMRPEESP
jgi:hypothetical protein